MKVAKKLETQFKIIAVLCIVLFGGVTIWSCTQDELDGNGQPVYRYTAEEIAALKTMAEEYGVPNIRFITESKYPLPSLEDMKQSFIEFAIIKQTVNQQLELIDSTNTALLFRTRQIPFKRNQNGTTEITKSPIDLSRFVSALGTNLWLNLGVTVIRNEEKPLEKPKFEVSGSLALPESDGHMFFEKTGESASASWKGVNSIGVSYQCTVYKYSWVYDSGTGKNEKVVIMSDNVSVSTSTSI